MRSSVVVVDLAVEDDPDVFRLVRHRLQRRLAEVHDGETHVAQIGIGGGIRHKFRVGVEIEAAMGKPPGGDAEPVGTAMPERVEARRALGHCDRTIRRDEAEDPAHD